MTLKDWSERGRAQQEIIAEVQPDLSAIPGATTFAFTPPPFNQEESKTPVQIVIHGPLYEVLIERCRKIRAALANHPMVTNFDSDLDLNKPELRIEVNRDKAADLGIPLETIGKTLEGMEYLVIVQTQAQHRGTRSDSKQLQVRGTQGT